MSQTNRYSRKTGPEVTIKLWEIFNSMNEFSSEQQLIEELCRQLSQILEKSVNEDKCRLIVNNALDDKLLIYEENTTRIGLMRIKPSYNRFTFGDITNDWFCFECDSCEQNCPLIDCQTCFRAFHRKCLKSKSNVSDAFRCEYCLKVENPDKSLKINRLDRKAMNKLFGLVLKNFENSIDDFDIYSEYELESNCMTNVLIFQTMDLTKIKWKIESEDYNNVEELDNDFKHFIHNFVVYPINDLNPDFEDFLEENISYLKGCSQCFYNLVNRDRGSDDWFLKVCDPPHSLVYAQLQHQPFWPSKVIQEISEDKYCVQFFESPLFERSIVNRLSTKPIDFEFESKKYRNKEIRQSLTLLSQHMKILIDSGVNPNNQYTNALNFFERKQLLQSYKTKVKIASKSEIVSKKLKTNNSQAIPIDSDQQNPIKGKSMSTKDLHLLAEEYEVEECGQEMETSYDLIPIAGPSTQSSLFERNKEQAIPIVSVKQKQIKGKSLPIPILNPKSLPKKGRKVTQIGSQTDTSSELLVNRDVDTSAQMSEAKGMVSTVTDVKKMSNFERFLADKDIETKDKFQICLLIMKFAILRRKCDNNPNKSTVDSNND